MTPNDRNHARDRIYGGGQPFKLTYAPDVEDFVRWTLDHAERVTRDAAEQPPEPPAPNP